MSTLRYFKEHIDQLTYTLGHCDLSQFDCLTQMISNHRKTLFFTGIGKNGHVAAKAASTFCSVGIPSYYINPVDAMHGDMGIVQAGDLIIAVSKSGTTEELLKFLLQASNKSAQIVLIHSNDRLIIPLDCHKIYVPIQKECDHLNIVPTASIVIFTALLQSVACELANQSKLTISNFVFNHPGGTIGKLNT